VNHPVDATQNSIRITAAHWPPTAIASEHSLILSADIRNKVAYTMTRDMLHLETIFIEYNMLRGYKLKKVKLSP
jgi:hypothetical protein